MANDTEKVYAHKGFKGNLEGTADVAIKLNSSAGSATQPVYFYDGKPTACSYTLGKSVPSDAKFTDTNTTYSAGTGLSLSGTTFSIAGASSAASGKVLKANGSGGVYWGDDASGGGGTDLPGGGPGYLYKNNGGGLQWMTPSSGLALNSVALDKTTLKTDQMAISTLTYSSTSAPLVITCEGIYSNGSYKMPQLHYAYFSIGGGKWKIAVTNHATFTASNIKLYRLV